MTHDEFKQANTRKRAAWLRDLLRKTMTTQPHLTELWFNVELDDGVQFFRYAEYETGSDEFLIGRSGFQHKVTYRSYTQAIVIASLLAFEVLGWPEEYEWLKEVHEYYIVTMRLVGKRYSDANKTCVPDY